MNLNRDSNGIWISSEDAKIHYPKSDNDSCFEIESNSFWFSHRNNVLKEVLNRFPFASNFVDVGGGNGYQTEFLSSAFPKKDFILLEPGIKGCLNARKRGIKNVYCMTFEIFPIERHYIGGVGLFDVIEHI